MLQAALAIFFLSGIAALSYQVAWQRMLVIFSGVDVHSATIVVAAFMVGLGAGSLAGGRVADRVSPRGSLALFAGAELAVALFGAMSPWLFYGVLYQKFGDAAIGLGGTALVLAIALFFPTFLMGASLPLLSRGLTRTLSDAAATVGKLYGLNTLGAATGAVLTTFVLLPQLGMAGSITVAAVLNTICAAAGVALARAAWRSASTTSRESIDSTSAAERSSPSASAGLPLGAWLAVFALSGFIALSLEIVWFRMLGVMLKSTAFTFGTLLALYLGGVGAGSTAGSLVAARVRRPDIAFFALHAAAGAYAALVLTAFVYGVRHASALHWFATYFAGYDAIDIRSVVMSLRGDDVAGTPVRDFWRLYVLLPAVLFGPPTFMAGVSFPLLQRAVQRDLSHIGRRVGALLAANILGSTLGAFVTGWLLLDWLGTPGTLKLVFGLSAGIGLLGLRALSWRVSARIAAYAIAVLLAAGILAIMPAQRPLWASLHGVEPNKIMAAEDGSGLSVLRADPDFRRVVVYVNGLGQSWIPYGNIHTILGALPVFAHPHPKSVAVIGLGSGDTLFAVAGRPDLSRVTSIEIIAPQLTTLREYDTVGYPGLRAILTDQRIEHVFGDGRLYLRRARRKYDVIEADALRPTSAFSGNLYSDEYFRLLKDHLNPGGLAVTWAPTARIVRTFSTVFPYVWWQGQILMGSDAPITVDRAAILERLRQPETQLYFDAAGVDLENMLAPYLTGPWTSDGRSRPSIDGTDINTDLYPRDEFDIPSLLGRKTTTGRSGQ